MLTKVTAFALATVAYVNCQEQLFLNKEQSKANNFEIYTPTSLEQNVEGTNLTTKVGDIQFKCQYMAWLNFYNLQDLANDKDYRQFPIPGKGNSQAIVSFCRLLDKDFVKNKGCE